MKLMVQPDVPKCAEMAALYVIKTILDFNPTSKMNFILGVPCAQTSEPFFAALVKNAKKKKLSFQNVTVFTMAAYVGISKGHEASIETFLWNKLFKFIDVDPKNVHVLNGVCSNPQQECDKYEKLIDSLGPVDLFVSDVQSDGNVAFNEPGSSLTSLTRMKPISFLSQRTLEKQFGCDDVPSLVLTVGVGTIMKSLEVMFYVTGYDRADALKSALEGGISTMCPFSMFQQHPKVIVFCDNDSTLELKVKTVQYFKSLKGTIEKYQL